MRRTWVVGVFCTGAVVAIVACSSSESASSPPGADGGASSPDGAAADAPGSTGETPDGSSSDAAVSARCQTFAATLASLGCATTPSQSELEIHCQERMDAASSCAAAFEDALACYEEKGCESSGKMTTVFCNAEERALEACLDPTYLDGGTCVDLPDPDLVTPQTSASALPGATGGTIPDGIYALTAAVFHDGPIPVGHGDIGMTYRFRQLAVPGAYRVAKVQNDPYDAQAPSSRATISWETSGAEITSVTFGCGPTEGGSRKFSYDATSGLRLHDEALAGKGELYTFTKQ